MRAQAAGRHTETYVHRLTSTWMPAPLKGLPKLATLRTTTFVLFLLFSKTCLQPPEERPESRVSCLICLHPGNHLCRLRQFESVVIVSLWQQRLLQQMQLAKICAEKKTPSYQVQISVLKNGVKCHVSLCECSHVPNSVVFQYTDA